MERRGAPELEVDEQERHIYLADLMRFMKQEEAIKAMHLFEGAQEHCRVSKKSLKNWVVNAFRERKALALTLNDTKHAVNKLNLMANVVVCLIVSLGTHSSASTDADRRHGAVSPAPLPPGAGMNLDSSGVFITDGGSPISASACPHDDGEDEQNTAKMKLSPSPEREENLELLPPPHLLPSSAPPLGEATMRRRRARGTGTPKRMVDGAVLSTTRGGRNPNRSADLGNQNWTAATATAPATPRSTHTALTSASQRATPSEGDSGHLFTLHAGDPFQSPPPGTKLPLSTRRETSDEIPSSSRRRSDVRRQGSAPAPAEGGKSRVGSLFSSLWLLILGIATTQFFVFVGSQLVVAIFVFGNTLKTIFEAIIFLFLMHPFDVGDRCEIEEVQVVVEEMNILTTVFLRYDNLKIYYPNSVLATKPIMNFYRSPDMGEGIDFSIHVDTPVEKLTIMKERILCYINSKKDHWYPGAMVVLRDVDDTNKLKVSIWLRHTLNSRTWV